MSTDRSLELREKEFNLAKDVAAYSMSREYDLQYLKLTVVIVLLIVIVFYITCKFNAKKAAEKFSSSPQLSANTNNQYRSDPKFDWYHL